MDARELLIANKFGDCRKRERGVRKKSATKEIAAVFAEL